MVNCFNSLLNARTVSYPVAEGQRIARLFRQQMELLDGDNRDICDRFFPEVFEVAQHSAENADDAELRQNVTMWGHRGQVALFWKTMVENYKE